MCSNVLVGRGAAAGLAVVGLVTLGACTAGPPEPAPVSELAAYETRIWGDLGGATVDPRQGEAEERIAACMAAAGFEYTPQVDPDRHQYSVPTVLTREHAEAFGYGETIPPAPGVTPGRWALQVGGIPGEAENEEYRSSLSAQAEEEYWVALNGDVAPDEAETAALEDFGCHGRAYAEVYADLEVPAAFRDAEAAIRKAGHDVELDPEVSAAVDRWSGCMADAGYPGLVGRHDGVNVVVDAANDLPVPPDMSFDEIAEVYATELAALQDLERTVALTDVACLEDADFVATWDRVKGEIDARVVETYREDLEAWAAWAEELRAAAS